MYSLYNLKSNNGAFTNSWTNNVHNLLCESGLPYMIDKNIVSRLDLNLIIQRIHDQYIQTWFSELEQSLVNNISIVQNQFLLRTIFI